MGFIICGVVAYVLIKLYGKEPPRCTALCSLDFGLMLMLCLHVINKYVEFLNVSSHWLLKRKSYWRREKLSSNPSDIRTI